MCGAGSAVIVVLGYLEAYGALFTFLYSKPRPVWCLPKILELGWTAPAWMTAVAHVAEDAQEQVDDHGCEHEGKVPEHVAVQKLLRRGVLRVQKARKTTGFSTRMLGGNATRDAEGNKERLERRRAPAQYTSTD